MNSREITASLFEVYISLLKMVIVAVVMYFNIF